MSEAAASTDTAGRVPGEPATTNPGEDEQVRPKENGADVTEESKTEPVAAPSKPKYRHDWYQTPTDVYVNVMIKGLKNENVSVSFEEKMASLNYKCQRCSWST